VWEDDFSPFPSTTLLVAHARSAFEDKDIVVENKHAFSDGKAVSSLTVSSRRQDQEGGQDRAEKIFNFIRPLSLISSGALKATAIIRHRPSTSGA